MGIYYTAIDRANKILEYTDNFDQNNALLKQLKAELYFIRALCHYQLAVLFCKPYNDSDLKGMPYMLKSEMGKPARLSQGEYFTFLNTDLANAKNLMSTDFFVVGRTNSAAITALQARVALHQGDWANADTYATDVIENGRFSLATDSEYPDIWNDANDDDVEVIFKLLRVTGDGLLGDEYRRADNNDYFFHPSNAIMNLYDANDVRFYSFFNVSGGEYAVSKHNGRPGEATNLVDIKVLRVSEMYLIRAEAKAHQNLLEDATNDIDTLLSRRISGFTPYATFGSFEAAMAEIQLQCRLELAYEGHRFYDLKRWGLPIHRLPEDVLYTSGVDLEAGDYRFVFPIPQQEIFGQWKHDSERWLH